MKLDEALKRLEKAVVCERCHMSGKECKDDCPTQYEAGTVGELVEALETILDYCIVELKGENNTSEQVEKKCETCKYWNGGYVTFVCCECKDKSEWK